MPKMMTSAIAIMALSLGLPAVAADEAPAMDPLAQAKEAVSDVVKPVERWAGQKPEETAESGVTEEGADMEDAASTADDAATESEAAMEGAATTVDEATAESEAAMDGESTMESDAAMDGAATAEGEAAMDGEVAAESEHSMDAESEAAMDGEAAMEGEQGAEAGMAEGDAAGWRDRGPDSHG